MAKELEGQKLLISPEHPSEILTDGMLVQLGACLPRLVKMRAWNLPYRVNTDGTSLLTFYSRLKDYTPTLIVVQDTSKNVFGAYVTESWHINQFFYGTGESFLFKFNVYLFAERFRSMESSQYTPGPESTSYSCIAPPRRSPLGEGMEQG